jgi:glucose/arabinose dehydrogenase
MCPRRSRCPVALSALLAVALGLWVVAAGNPPAQGQRADVKVQPPAQVRAGVDRPQRRELTPERLRSLRAPPGFSVGVFARNLGRPRMLHVLEDGTVLVTRPTTNDVIALRDRDGDGRADGAATVVSGIEKAHGITHRGRTLYVAGTRKLFTVEIRADGSFGPARMLLSDLPDGGQHDKRTIGLGRDGMLYVSIGSDCNDCVESNPEHATLLRMKPDGSARTVFARGLRNTIGFDWHPRTGELWGADIGTDFRGDDVPPEEINRLVEAAHYGWPYCYADRKVDPVRDAPEGTTSEKFCADSKPASLTLPAHSSPIGWVFYRGSQFPPEYREDAFLAVHGSWNRGAPQAPVVTRVHFEDGRPVHTEPFLTGFLIEDGRAWFGRPAGIAVAKDGSLLVSDDESGAIYIVSHGTARGDRESGADLKDAPGLLARVARLTGFEAPESVIHDEQQDVYFVSNINGFPGGKDNNGFISRVSPEGKIEALKFIEAGRARTVLHAPKGLAIAGDTLWVTDIDSVRGFDRQTGAHRKTVDLATTGAMFLNDIAVGPDGALFVTDTGWRFDAENNRTHPGPDRIYRIGADGQARVIAEGPALGGPNGIAWDGKRLVVVQAEGKDIFALGPGGGKPVRLASGVGMFDGLVLLPGGGLLASSQHDGTIYRGNGDQLIPLLPSPPRPADIGFDRKRNRLLVPSPQGNWVDVWRLPR